MAVIMDIGLVVPHAARPRPRRRVLLRLLRRLWYRHRMIALARRELANPQLRAEADAIDAWRRQ